MRGAVYSGSENVENARKCGWRVFSYLQDILAGTNLFCKTHCTAHPDLRQNKDFFLHSGRVSGRMKTAKFSSPSRGAEFAFSISVLRKLLFFDKTQNFPFRFRETENYNCRSETEFINKEKSMSVTGHPGCPACICAGPDLGSRPLQRDEQLLAEEGRLLRAGGRPLRVAAPQGARRRGVRPVRKGGVRRPRRHAQHSVRLAA